MCVTLTFNLLFSKWYAYCERLYTKVEVPWLWILQLWRRVAQKNCDILTLWLRSSFLLCKFSACTIYIKFEAWNFNLWPLGLKWHASYACLWKPTYQTWTSITLPCSIVISPGCTHGQDRAWSSTFEPGTFSIMWLYMIGTFSSSPSLYVVCSTVHHLRCISFLSLVRFGDLDPNLFR